ncbi:MAG: exodeoxyribonuclease III [Coriobacteriaceae bacterium]|uniref:exodeoxyribonuclease III n=1 Tax=Tractidigestivibacter sp. TaxID=2847320 RepID=UPI002A81396B|nr:exodeoxyribonuclease III [Tractidigestivibacter sp.]MCI6548982.1 exodeoxyribonuclease III [Coriobacteriaceae bacterium]MDY4535673.1 exodeoxyribonuclease III [Tractidigestivibacter sp.]
MADTTRSLRFVSWNVNGLRAVLKKEPGFARIFDTLGADVFALQETKLQEGQVELDLPGYHQYWSYAERKGYSGTAVFTREEPLQVVRTIGSPVADDEGRVCALEFPNLWFVDVYTPNSKAGLARLDERMEWDARYRDFLSDLARDKPVVTCGDFNVAHEEIDLARPDDNHGSAGFSDEERESFTRLLESGLVDTFRERHPNLAGAYSWWSYRMRARERGIGWRIDYFLVSPQLMPKTTGAAILDDVYGSDHCPIELELELEL